MATEHEHWLERGEIYALGALDGQELREFQAHLDTDCAICAAYVRETRETLNLLHRSLRRVTPRPELKSRITEQLDREKVVAIAAPQAKPAARRQRIAGAIAAGLIGIVLVGVFYRDRHREAMNAAIVNLLRDPATRDLRLYGAGPTPQAQGRFLWNDAGEGHVFVAHLPALPRGKSYAVWTIAAHSAPRYVGAIATDASGRGAAHIKSPPGAAPGETFAVSLENEGTTAAPAGPIVLISKPS